MRESFYNIFQCLITFMLLFAILFTISLFVTSEICIAKSSNTLYVGGSGEQNYTSIQDAIFSSDDGYTVVVSDGIYNKNIIINKSINLICVDKTNISINGNNKLYCILIKSSNVMISGFTIKNSDVGVLFSGQEYSFCNITNNIFTNNSEAIRVINSSENKISRNILTNHSSFGILLYDSKNNSIINNTLVENNRGIYLGRWSDNNVISENNFTNYNYGLKIDYSFNNHITNNLIQNGIYGVYLSNSNNNNITNNIIAYHIQTGIYTSNSDENELSPNLFLNNNHDISKKTNPPKIKTPGFEISILFFIIFVITFFKKNK